MIRWQVTNSALDIEDKWLHSEDLVKRSFLAESVEAIAMLPSETLATVELTPSGKGLRWDEPDIDLSIQEN